MKQFNFPAVKQRFDRVAEHYDANAFIMEDIVGRLMSRLSFIKLEPKHCVDLGCGTGIVSKALQNQFPNAKVTGVDFSQAMIEQYRKKQALPAHLTSAQALPFPDNSIDLIVSNIMLPWCDDLSLVFKEAKRVLRPDGVLLFSTFGPDTFCELRQAWAGVDERAHVQVFLDMHDVGDALLKSGFADPVMDVERVTLKYKTLDVMLKEIKAMGLSNLLQNRFRGLTGKSVWKQFENHFLHDSAGKLDLSLELVFAYAIKNDEIKNNPEEQTFSLDALRRTLRGHR